MTERSREREDLGRERWVVGAPHRHRRAPHVPARVLIIEGHWLLAQSLAVALEGEGATVDIAPLDSEESLLSRARRGAYEVVVIEPDLRETLGDGARLIRPLTATGTRVVVLTTIDDPEWLGECVEEGATEICSKDEPFDRLRSLLVEAAGHDDLVATGRA